MSQLEHFHLAKHISGKHYDNVPTHLFDSATSIIDIGSGSGLNAILSKHRYYFRKAEHNENYQGVDIKKFEKNYLEPITLCNILDFSTTRQYDLVLALHIVEHIAFEHWPKLIKILRGLVAPNGYLVISTPYRQNESAKSENPEHVVFDIDKNTLASFLSNAVFLKRKAQYNHFREEGESRIKAGFRVVWRLLTRNKYRYRRLHELIAIQKRTRNKKTFWERAKETDTEYKLVKKEKV